MSSCERCWSDAVTESTLRGVDAADAYRRLLLERKCSPEDQAGPHARLCPDCRRLTLHQFTGECMHCGLSVAR